MTTILYFFWDGFSGEVDLSANYGWLEYTMPRLRMDYTMPACRLEYTLEQED